MIAKRVKPQSKKTTNNQGRTVKCGKCGQKSPAGLAHNARTCGTTPQPSAPVGRKRRGGETAFDEKVPQVNVALTPRNVIAVWEKHIEYTYNPHSEPAPRTSPHEERYTEDELITLWTLESGKTGKLGKDKGKYELSPIGNLWKPTWGETEKATLLNFVENIEVHGPGATPHAWWKFFKTLGTQAKKAYTKNYIDPKPVHRTAKMDAFFGLSLEGVLANLNIADVEPVEVLKAPPVNVIPALLKDGSTYVRKNLAAIRDLPEPAIMLLVEDKKIEVLRELLSSENRSVEVITKIHDRIVDIERGGVTTTTEDYIRREIIWTHSAIAKHPNLPLHLQEEYLNNPKYQNNYIISEALYQNVNLSKKKVTDVRLKIKQKIDEIIDEINYPIEEEGGVDPVNHLKEEVQRLRTIHEWGVKYGHGSQKETIEYIESKIEDKEKWHFSASSSVSIPLMSDILTPAQLEKFYFSLEGYKYSSSALAGILRNKKVTNRILEDICVSKKSQDPSAVDISQRLQLIESIAKSLLHARKQKG